ncbi:hypothetical protein ANCCAN_10659 [Ancylostoma caninum]|uniref:NTR domain-containing protein n=1 Tax=Ancylostoma caninum TaxID=29170 RepID=A0A368GG14_ANCCA|nr:hypothetical protein ANCCAN_10659 [Ancylostoma caninum]
MMLLLLVSLACLAAAEDCNCARKTLRERLCDGSYGEFYGLSLVVSKGEDGTKSTGSMKVYTVQHEKVYKNSSVLSTRIKTPVKCGVVLRSGTEFLIGGNSYSNGDLYMQKCDLRKKWDKVSSVVKTKLEEYYESPASFCSKPRKTDIYLDDF